MHHGSFHLSSGRAIVIMGVSGSGKSTIGNLLANSLGCAFLDADDFHPKENKERMRGGIALTDSDRLPWLETLRDTLIDYILRGKMVVLACSALKPSYRQVLRTADFEQMLEMQCQDSENSDNLSSPNGGSKSSSVEAAEQLLESGQLKVIPKSHTQMHRVEFFLLNGCIELFASRLDKRFKEGAHFMPPALLQSQLDSLEISKDEDDIMYLDAKMSPADIVQQVKESVCGNT